VELSQVRRFRHTTGKSRSGDRQLDGEHEAPVAQGRGRANVGRIAVDIRVPVPEVEGQVLDAERQTHVPVVVLVIRPVGVDEVAVVLVALLPAQRTVQNRREDRNLGDGPGGERLERPDRAGLGEILRRVVESGSGAGPTNRSRP